MFKFIKKSSFLQTLLGIISCFRVYYIFLLDNFLRKHINNIKITVKYVNVIGTTITYIINKIFLILGKEKIINDIKSKWYKVKVRLDEKFYSHFIYIIVTFIYSLYKTIGLWILFFFFGKIYLLITLTVIFFLLVDYIIYKNIDIGITFWHMYAGVLTVYIIITNLNLIIYIMFFPIIILGLFYVFFCDFIKTDEKEKRLSLYKYETIKFFIYIIIASLIIRFIIIPEIFFNQSIRIEIMFTCYIMIYPYINLLKSRLGIRKNFFSCRKDNFTLYLFFLRVIIGIVLFFVSLVIVIIFFSTIYSTIYSMIYIYTGICICMNTGSEYIEWFLEKIGFLDYIQQKLSMQLQYIVFCDVTHLTKEDAIHLNIDNPLRDTEIEEPNIIYHNTSTLPDLLYRTFSDPGFRYVKLNEVHGISESSYTNIIKNLNNDLRINFLGNFTYNTDNIHSNNLTNLFTIRRQGGSTVSAYCNFLDHMFPLNQYATDRVVYHGATIHTFWNRSHNQTITSTWFDTKNSLNRVCRGIRNYYEDKNIHLMYGTIHSFSKTYFYVYAKGIHNLCGLSKSDDFKDLLFMVTENKDFLPVSQKDTIYPQLMYYKLNNDVEKGMIVQGYENMKGIIDHKDIKFNPVTKKWYLVGEDATASGTGLSLKDLRSFNAWNNKYRASQLSPELMARGKHIKNALGQIITIN